MCVHLLTPIYQLIFSEAHTHERTHTHTHRSLGQRCHMARTSQRGRRRRCSSFSRRAFVLVRWGRAKRRWINVCQCWECCQCSRWSAERCQSGAKDHRLIHSCFAGAGDHRILGAAALCSQIGRYSYYYCTLLPLFFATVLTQCALKLEVKIVRAVFLCRR